jgi:hypothetical protein
MVRRKCHSGGIDCVGGIRSVELASLRGVVRKGLSWHVHGPKLDWSANHQLGERPRECSLLTLRRDLASYASSVKGSGCPDV